MFYHVEPTSKYFTLALEKERKFIEAAIKKPLFSDKHYTGQVVIGKDSGTAEGEQYSITITSRAPVLDVEAIRVQSDLFRMNSESRATFSSRQ